MNDAAEERDFEMWSDEMDDSYRWRLLTLLLSKEPTK